MRWILALDCVIKTCIVNKAPTRVCHCVEFLSSFGEVCREAVQILYLGIPHGLIAGPIILLHELVVLFVLILFLGEAVVLELLLVDAVDYEQVIANLFFKTQRESVLFSRLEVCSHVDLVVGVFELAEDLVAVDKVLSNFLFDLFLSRHALKEEIL